MEQISAVSGMLYTAFLVSKTRVEPDIQYMNIAAKYFSFSGSKNASLYCWKLSVCAA